MNPHEALSTGQLLAGAFASAKTDGGRYTDAHWEWVSALHRRPDTEVFARAAAWVRDDDPHVRVLAADVLGQLGPRAAGDQRPFHAQSIPLLRELLGDRDNRVVAAATTALGHLKAGDETDLRPLVHHSSGDVRFALAHALGAREEPFAIALLMLLMTDPEPVVRDWATFGLGSLSETDTAEIRDALAARLLDPDEDVRGEAMVGLAHRDDDRALRTILLELTSQDASQLVIDAAHAWLEHHPDCAELQDALNRRGI